MKEHLYVVYKLTDIITSNTITVKTYHVQETSFLLVTFWSVLNKYSMIGNVSEFEVNFSLFKCLI